MNMRKKVFATVMEEIQARVQMEEVFFDDGGVPQ